MRVLTRVTWHVARDTRTRMAAPCLVTVHDTLTRGSRGIISFHNPAPDSSSFTQGQQGSEFTCPASSLLWLCGCHGAAARAALEPGYRSHREGLLIDILDRTDFGQEHLDICRYHNNRPTMGDKVIRLTSIRQFCCVLGHGNCPKIFSVYS